ncbi:MAG: hypothetical protein H6816_12145 [Phycisphaerales bacterium]|nr:hypothetical protein [Phycisphaerales bacterium]
MKKAKRIRYTLMCASIMCCVALACGWLATLRWSIRYVDNVRRFQVGLAAGGVNLFVAQGRDMTAPRTKAREWHVITDRPYILDERGWLVQVCWREYPWLPRYVNAAQRVWLHLPPLWPLLLMTTIFDGALSVGQTPRARLLSAMWVRSARQYFRPLSRVRSECVKRRGRHPVLKACWADRQYAANYVVGGLVLVRL